MADSRQELALYVAGGSLRNQDQAAQDIQLQQDRIAALRGRLGRWREDIAGTVVTPEAAPADFRAALEDADERAYQRSLTEQGRDIPRLTPRNPLAAKALNRVYQAHDTVTSLPTPAGIGVLILFIVVLFLILIPATARGETRMLLLWDVLLGRKTMPGSTPAPAGTDSSDLFTPQTVQAALNTAANEIGNAAVDVQQIEQVALQTALEVALGLGGL